MYERRSVRETKRSLEFEFSATARVRAKKPRREWALKRCKCILTDGVLIHAPAAVHSVKVRMAHAAIPAWNERNIRKRLRDERSHLRPQTQLRACVGSEKCALPRLRAFSYLSSIFTSSDPGAGRPISTRLIFRLES